MANQDIHINTVLVTPEMAGKFLARNALIHDVNEDAPVALSGKAADYARKMLDGDAWAMNGEPIEF